MENRLEVGFNEMTEDEINESIDRENAYAEYRFRQSRAGKAIAALEARVKALEGYVKGIQDGAAEVWEAIEENEVRRKAELAEAYRKVGVEVKEAE